MKVKARVRNYESHLDTSLELSGFTVITGANYVGKSALLRSFDTAIRNAKGNRYLNDPKKPAQVDLTFITDEEEVLVEWSKEEGKQGIYRCNGGIFDGTSVINDVSDKISLAPVVINDTAIDLNYLEQGRRLVFTTSSAEFIYKALISLSSDSVFSSIVKDERSKSTKLSSSIKHNTAARQDKEATRAAMVSSSTESSLASLLNHLNDFGIGLENLGEAESILSSIESLTEKITTSGEYLTSLSKVVTDTEILIATSEIARYHENIQYLIDRIKLVTDAKDKYAAVLSTIDSYPILKQSVISQFIAAKDTVDSVADLNALISVSNEVTVQLSELNKVLETLPDVGAADIHKDIKLIDINLRSVELQLTGIESSLQQTLQILTNVKVCPTCGQSLCEEVHSE